MAEIINKSIEAATGIGVDAGDTEAFAAFAKAVEDGMLLDTKTLDAQAKRTEAAVENGTSKSTEIIQDGLEANAESLRQDLSALGNTLTAGLAPISDKLGEFITSANNIANAIRNIKVVVRNTGGGTTTEVPNQALGLTTSEMRGVISAAQREKRNMPHNAGLTVANTSELVMTPKQAKKVFGQVQMPEGVRNRQQDMFRGRRVKEVVKETSVDSNGDVVALTNKINDLLERADKKDLFKNEQAISINVDGKREINLKGMKSFDKEIRDVFKKQIKNISTKAEVNAVKGTIRNLIRRLKEVGIDGI